MLDPRRRRRLAGAVAFGIVGIGLPLQAQATVLQVATANENALESAINAANALAFQTSPAQPVVIEFASSLIGQTILLHRAMPVLMVDHVTMRVAGASPTARVIIDASSAPTAMRISSWQARIQNVRFQNTGTPGSQHDLVTAFGTVGLSLANCDFDNATGNVLWLIGCAATVVEDCNIRASIGGFAVTGGCTDLLVSRCTFTGNERALLLSVASNVQIRDSLFDGNITSAMLMPVCSDVIFGPGNTVRNTTASAGLIADGSVRLRVTGNLFQDNPHSAIELKNLCYETTIADSTLTRNGTATGAFQLVVNSCVNVRVEGLQCTAGGSGIYAGVTGPLSIGPSATSLCNVTGNSREGIRIDRCADVAMNQVSVSDNLRAVAGSQLMILDSNRVNVTASTVAAAAGSSRLGVHITGSGDVRFGLGSQVLDNGGGGILAVNSNDLVFGTWDGNAASLLARGRLPLRIETCQRVLIAGTPTAPCTVQAGTSAAGAAFLIDHCPSTVLGPDVLIDGRQTEPTGIQLTECGGTRIHGTTIRGHTGFGLIGISSPSLLIRGCTVDGGTGGASGDGILLQPGCNAAFLLGNLVQRQQGGAFVVRDSNDTVFGPGNRAIDNAGDGFSVSATGSGAPTFRVTIQSAAAVGRGLSPQAGFRFTRMRATLTNVTATRNGTGVALSLGSVATLVNAISWGNNLDRSRDAGSSGTWLHGLRATTAGTGTPGTWSEQNMLLGVDPNFVSAGTGDVRLAQGSPAIDSGLHATPAGAGLPCADAALQPRIRGGVIDRGALEFVSGAGSGNSLELAGPWLRGYGESQLDFTVRRPTLAGQVFLLLVSGSGTGPGFTAPGGSIAPLVPDFYTDLLLGSPSWCLGSLNGSGIGFLSLPLTPSVVPLLPELSFVAVHLSGSPTNPVVTRFLQ